MDGKTFINKLEKDLENLEPGKVVDVGSLELPQAEYLAEKYSLGYNVNGPNKDELNPGKYALDFSLKKGEVQNA